MMLCWLCCQYALHYCLVELICLLMDGTLLQAGSTPPCWVTTPMCTPSNALAHQFYKLAYSNISHLNGVCYHRSELQSTDTAYFTGFVADAERQKF